MTITQLIDKLNELKSEHGDARVHITFTIDGIAQAPAIDFAQVATCIGVEEKIVTIGRSA